MLRNRQPRRVPIAPDHRKSRTTARGLGAPQHRRVAKPGTAFCTVPEKLARLSAACQLELFKLFRTAYIVQPYPLIILAIIVLILVFPVQADKVLMLLLFGGVAGGVGLLIFLAIREALKEPEKEGSIRQSFKQRPIETFSMALVIFGLLGFATGLLFATLGFEPTTQNGTKLWIIAGFVIIAGGAIGAAYALFRK